MLAALEEAWMSAKRPRRSLPRWHPWNWNPYVLSAITLLCAWAAAEELYSAWGKYERVQSYRKTVPPPPLSPSPEYVRAIERDAIRQGFDGLILLAGGLLLGFRARRLFQLRDVRDGPRCQQCGYILKGLPEPRCPECGVRREDRQGVVDERAIR